MAGRGTATGGLDGSPAGVLDLVAGFGLDFVAGFDLLLGEHLAEGRHPVEEMRGVTGPAQENLAGIVDGVVGSLADTSGSVEL